MPNKKITSLNIINVMVDLEKFIKIFLPRISTTSPDEFIQKTWNGMFYCLKVFDLTNNMLKCMSVDTTYLLKQVTFTRPKRIPSRLVIYPHRVVNVKELH